MTIFERLRIPGPKPNLIFGNAIDIAKQGSSKVFPNWTKKYGPIVGFYIGGRPQVLVTDLNLVRQIMIKDFNLFSTRHIVVPGGIHPQFQFRGTVLWTKGNFWRQLRSTMSPWFSSSKLSRMESLMMQSIEETINDLDQKVKCTDELNLKPIVEELSFSISTKSFLGQNISLNCEGHKRILEAVTPKLQKSLLAMAMLLFPSLTFIAYPLRAMWETLRMKMAWSPEGFCCHIVERVVKIRKDAKVKTIDILQFLLDNERVESTTESTTTDNTIPDSSLATRKLSLEDITSNAFIFLIAGYETVSTTLQFTIYNLVNNQDIQDQLRNELKRQIEIDGNGANLKTFTKVPLLLYTIKETLRLFPPASPGTSRFAEETYEHDGFLIPKGTGIFIGVSSIHNDPKLWFEPEKFKPERFAKEYNKLSFLPFGAG